MTKQQELHALQQEHDAERKEWKEQLDNRDRVVAELRHRLADIHQSLNILFDFADATTEEALFS